MEKQTIFIRLFATIALLSLLLFNPGSARSESPPGGLTKAQQQAKISDGSLAKANDPDVQEEKSLRFQELEWLIKQHLIKQYQKMETVEDLEESLD